MSIRPWHVVLFVVALLAFAIARAPAAVFAPKRDGGFTYAAVEGTIWRAQFTQARAGPFDLGALSWRLSFWDLIQGRFLAHVSMTGGRLVGDVRLLANADGDRRLITGGLQLNGVALGGLTFAGGAQVAATDILFVRGACARAEGAARSDMLAVNEAVLRWRGPPLSGQPLCAGDTADWTLQPADGAGGPTRITLLLGADGRGRWRAQLPTDRPEAALALTQAGVAHAVQAGAMTAEGELRWFPF